jgi:hypothetical protein
MNKEFSQKIQFDGKKQDSEFKIKSFKQAKTLINFKSESEKAIDTSKYIL